MNEDDDDFGSEHVPLLESGRGGINHPDPYDDDNIDDKNLDPPSLANQYLSSILVMFAATFVDMIGFGLLLPLLPFYLQTLVLANDGNLTTTIPPSSTTGVVATSMNGTYSFAPTPALNITVERQKHIDAEESLYYGLIQGAFSFGQFVGAILLGVISDRFGRKFVLLIGLMGNASFYVAFALEKQLELLVIFRFLGGIFAGTGGIAASFVADVTNEKERPKWMGFLGAVFAAGIVCGPSLGAVVAAVLPTNPDSIANKNAVPYACLGAAGLCVLNVVFAFFALKESPRFEPRVSGPMGSLISQPKDKVVQTSSVAKTLFVTLAQGNLILIFVASFSYQFLFATLEVVTNLLAKDLLCLKPQWIGGVLAAYGVILILTQMLLFSRLTKKFGVRVTAMLGSFFTGIFLFLIPILTQPDRWSGVWVRGETPTVPRCDPLRPQEFTPASALGLMPVLMLIALCGMCNGVVVPGISVLASLLSKKQHGSVLGMNRGFAAMARTVSPIVSTVLYDQVSNLVVGSADNDDNPNELLVLHKWAPYWLGTLFALIAVFMFAFLRVDESKELEFDDTADKKSRDIEGESSEEEDPFPVSRMAGNSPQKPVPGSNTFDDVVAFEDKEFAPLSTSFSDYVDLIGAEEKAQVDITTRERRLTQTQRNYKAMKPSTPDTRLTQSTKAF